MADKAPTITLSRLQPDAVPTSPAPFSQVVLDDRYAFFSGLVAADFPAGLAVMGDVAAETRAVLDTLAKMFDELGLAKTGVVKVDVHLSDLGDFTPMDQVFREFFQDAGFPARTTVESAQLFGGSKVEITCQVRR